jgi:hypothetical protein
MDISSWQESGQIPVTILQLKGDLITEEQLVDKAQAIFQEGARDIILDLGGVPYISSAGLRAIHVIYMLLRSADPQDEETAVRGIARGTYKSPHLKLVKPSRNGLKALTTSGYDLFLDIHDSIPKAVASFK